MKVLIITFLIVLADQATKLYVKGISIPLLGIEFPGMPYQSSIPVIGNFFQITFIENPGMAFGLQIGGKLFLSLFTIFATLLLFFFLYKNRHESLLLRLSLALILGGAIGNLIDRVFYGKIYGYAPYFYGRVVDFFHFDFPNFTIFGKTIYSWPIFNIADISVTVGFLLILIGYKKIFAHPEETPVLAESGNFEGEFDDNIDYSAGKEFHSEEDALLKGAVLSESARPEEPQLPAIPLAEELPATSDERSGDGEKKTAGQSDRPADEIV